MQDKIQCLTNKEYLHDKLQELMEMGYANFFVQYEANKSGESPEFGKTLELMRTFKNISDTTGTDNLDLHLQILKDSFVELLIQNNHHFLELLHDKNVL